MNYRFKHAIVRRPCASMVNGITTSNLGTPDYYKALMQHDEYIQALTECGLIVTVLESDERYPDSCFIEDVALCTPKCAIITNPGAESRNAEKNGMKEVLTDYYSITDKILFPGTLDGGDIMMAVEHYYIGISERTNYHGADQLILILNKYGMTASKIQLSKMLHLKTGLSYLENNNLLISGEFVERDDFNHFNKILVDTDESYAANSLWINDRVLIPKGFEKTRRKIENAGYKTIVVDVSEFQKLDGGLSCLSLRF